MGALRLKRENHEAETWQRGRKGSIIETQNQNTFH